jgi:hypothetical protein
MVSFYGRMGMSPKTTKTILGYKESYKDLIKDEKILEEI